MYPNLHEIACTLSSIISSPKLSTNCFPDLAAEILLKLTHTDVWHLIFTIHVLQLFLSTRTMAVIFSAVEGASTMKDQNSRTVLELCSLCRALCKRYSGAVRDHISVVIACLQSKNCLCLYLTLQTFCEQFHDNK